MNRVVNRADVQNFTLLIIPESDPIFGMRRNNKSLVRLGCLNEIELGMKKYEQALADGICAEQARLFLPSYGMYVRWYWTASVQSVTHFLVQRLEHDAQKKFRTTQRPS
ncbi:FAD-dependent thymidylate synthase [Paenibacillus tarimensis]